MSGPYISPKNAVHAPVPCSSRSVLLLDKCPSHYIIFTRNPTASFNGPCFIPKTFPALLSYIGVLPSVVRSMYDFFSLKSYLTQNKVRSPMKPSSDSHHGRDTLNRWHYNKQIIRQSFPRSLQVFWQRSLNIGYTCTGVNCVYKLGERKYVQRTEEKQGSRL